MKRLDFGLLFRAFWRWVRTGRRRVGNPTPACRGKGFRRLLVNLMTTNRLGVAGTL